MKRAYSVVPRNASITVESRSPFEAELEARRQHPHLRDEDLIVVASSVAWERDAYRPGRSHTERLHDFTEQAEASGA